MCSASSEGIHDSSLQPMADRGAQSAGMRSTLLGQGFGLSRWASAAQSPAVRALEAQRLADALASESRTAGWG